MIFSSFRDSVQEIAEMLSRHHPAVRVMTFVGHSTGKSSKGFTHKEQLEVTEGQQSLTSSNQSLQDKCFLVHLSKAESIVTVGPSLGLTA